MGYLAQRVNAGVGAAAGRDARLVISDLRQGFFQFALHGRFLALNLPAQELAAVVFDAYRVSQDSGLCTLPMQTLLHEIQHLLRFCLLALAAIGDDLFEDNARSFLVAHGDVRPCQV